MKLKFPIRRIAGHHLEEIKKWRDDGAAWAVIAEALNLEHPGADCKGDSVRKACLALSQDFSRNPKISEEKHPSTPVAARNAVADAPDNSPFEDFSRNLKKSEDKPAVTRVVEPTSIALLERVPDHVARGRAALARGNLSDEEAGIA